MLPNPLHPAIVHFPIVLMFLTPLVAIAALWMIRRGSDARRAWRLPVAAAVALAASAWASTASGNEASERVERVISERPVETHEESAELFLSLSGALVVVAVAGLARGTVGRSARVLSTVLALVIVAAGVRVGHTGGQLVYRYGAANAYTQGTGQRAGEAGGEVRER